MWILEEKVSNAIVLQEPSVLGWERGRSAALLVDSGTFHNLSTSVVFLLLLPINLLILRTIGEMDQKIKYLVKNMCSNF